MSWEDWYKPVMYGQVVYSPWSVLTEGDFASDFNVDAQARTVVSHDRVWVLWSYINHIIKADIPGDIWECGVFQGGTSIMMSRLLSRLESDRAFRMFDTFEGMPDCDKTKDAHKKGDFSSVDLGAIKTLIKYQYAKIYKGFIPDTFLGLEGKIAFVHVDVDIYKSVIDCCQFIWPRLSTGGVMVFDDYGFAQTRGGKEAVDEFFADKKTLPIVLPTGQAIVHKDTGCVLLLY